MAERTDLTFTSGGSLVAAWHYVPEGSAGTCVVMANGFSMTRHDGLPAYAEVLAAAGAHVLVFDHRHLGDSGGEPRQRFRRSEQLEDWRNAIAFAGTLDGVDAERIVLWGFSFSGGHVTTLAARRDDLAAVLVLCPFVNGVPRVLGTAPKQTAWILPRAIADLAGRHNLIPVTGRPGEHGAMTEPGEAEGFHAARSADSPWRNEISPGVLLTAAFVRPVARARSIRCPLWVGLGERDISVHAPSIERLAARAPRGELHRYDADHFEPFLGELPARIAGDQAGFLQRAGLL